MRWTALTLYQNPFDPKDVVRMCGAQWSILNMVCLKPEGHDGWHGAKTHFWPEDEVKQ